MKKIQYTIRLGRDGVYVEDNLIDKPQEKNGIISIPNGSVGCAHTCHPSLNSSGSLSVYKQRYIEWREGEIVRAFGAYYLKSDLARSNTLDYIAWALEYHPTAPGVNYALTPPAVGMVTTKLMTISDDDTVLIKDLSIEPIPENKAETMARELFSPEMLEQVRKQMKLKVKDFRLLIEAYRRKHLLKDEVTNEWVGLGSPSTYRSTLFTAVHQPEQPNVLNWYKLTKEGELYMEQLEKHLPALPEDYKVQNEINTILFTY